MTTQLKDTALNEADQPYSVETYSFPASFAQKRLWFVSQMAGGSVYNIYGAFKINGEFHSPAFNEAFQQLVARHEVLRTRFQSQGQEIFQLVDSVSDFRVITEDVSEVRNPTALATDICENEAAFIFDLEKGPLIRIKVIKCSDEQHVLSICLHHIIADGWSINVLVRELNELYCAVLTHTIANLAPMQFQYADYSVWQRQFIEKGKLAGQEQYWRNKLAGLSDTEVLPTDYKRNKIQGFEGNSLKFPIDATRTARLNEVDSKLGMTMFMTLFAAYGLLLHKHSSTRDFAVGTVVANRNRPQWEHLIGFFVNTLALRVQFPAHQTIQEYLQSVKKTCIEAFDQQDLPFENILDLLDVPRDISQNPVFQTMFVYQNNDQQSLEFPGATLVPFEVERLVSKYDLTFCVSPSGNELQGEIQYNTRLFDRQSIQRMADGFLLVLDQLLDDYVSQVSQISLLGSQEKATILHEWNDRYRDYNFECVHESVARTAALRPDHNAVVYHDQSLTYRELEEVAHHLSIKLLEARVKPGEIVAVELNRSPELIIAYLAIMKVGGAYLGINPDQPEERKRSMLEDADVKVIIRNSQGQAYGRKVVLISAAFEDQDIHELSLPKVSVDDHAYTVFTSGSTGKPKGVSITHRALSNLIQWHVEAFDVTAKDVATQVANMSFDASTWEIWPYLATGATLHILDEEILPDITQLQAEVIESGVTIVFWPTPLAENLFKLDWSQPGLALGRVLIGGDTLRLERLPDLPFKVYNNYGLSEACVVNTSQELTQHTDFKSIGRPISNHAVYILDEDMNPVPVGIAGEIYLGGVGLGRKYLKRPELTREHFVPDPFAEAGSLLYRTGDRAKHAANGEVIFLGREDRQVKIRGVRIELNEIEQLTRSVPNVDQAAIVASHQMGKPSGIQGFVTLKDQSLATDVKAELKRRLPANMMPTAISVLDAFPLTHNGKVDYKALGEQTVFADEQRHKQAPKTEVERQLVEIWQEVLKQENIGTNDNYFELGGDSILTIQVTSKAKSLGLRLTPKQIFVHQTIETLAKVISHKQNEVEAEEDLTGPFDLHPIQHWYFDQPGAEKLHFNHGFLLRYKGPVDHARLRHAYRQLVRHHDLLRVAYRGIDSGIITQEYQQTHLEDSPSCTQIEAFTEEERYEAIASFSDQLHVGLNPEGGKLFHVSHIQPAHGEADYVLFAVHHLIIDSFSWRILIEDFLQLYEHPEEGFKTKSTSYKKWVTKISEYACSEAFQKDIGYWQPIRNRYFKQIPIDRDLAPNRFGDTIREVTHVDADLTEKLKRIGLQYHTGVNTVLLAALTQVLTQWIDTEEILVSMESLGREPMDDAMDVSRTIGWFTALYPVLLSVRDQQSWPDVIRHVKETLNTVPLNGMPFQCAQYIARQSTELDNQAQISFNFLGQRTDDQPGNWEAIDLDSKNWIANDFPRQHLLDITAAIEGEVLQVNWIYHRELHHTETIQRLSEALVTSLQELTGQMNTISGNVFTPSDFPLTTLDQQQVDTIYNRVQQEKLPPISDIYPLSALQEGILFHALYAYESRAYFVQVQLNLTGKLDLDIFKSSWQLLLEQHEILRTSFYWADLELPVQLVHKSVTLSWKLLDFSEIKGEELERQLMRISEVEENKGFDLQKPSLMRLVLVKLGQDQYRLFWSYHHLIMDGWSFSLLLQRVFTSYFKQVQGHDAIDDLVYPFRNYLTWVSSQNKSKTLRFWEDHLAGFSAPAKLGIERVTTTESEHDYQEQVIEIAVPLTQRIKSSAQNKQLTLNGVFQSLWAVLLSHYSQSEKVVFGATDSGRSIDLEGIETMVGLFINTMPCPVVVDNDRSLEDWIRSNQNAQNERSSHSFLSLSDVKQVSGFGQDQGLFDSIFIFENYPGTSLEGKTDDLVIEAVQAYERIASSLVITVAVDESVRIRFGYDGHTYDHEQIQRLMLQYRSLVEQFADTDHLRVGDLFLLSADEQHQVTTLAKGPVWSEPFSGVIRRLEDQVVSTPQATALSIREQSMSYHDLWEQSGWLAMHLVREYGTGDEPIGVLMPRSLDMVLALLAVMRSGRAYIPMDPQFPENRLNLMVSNAEPCCIITTDRLKKAFKSLDAMSMVYDRVQVAALKFDDNLPLPVIRPQDSAYIIYTSGSTGTPKGVEISHESLENLLKSFEDILEPEPENTWLSVTTISFDIAALEIYLPLISGAQVRLADDEMTNDPFLLQEEITRAGPRFMQATPSTWKMLLDSQWPSNKALTILSGGEALPKEWASDLLSKVKQLYNVYGPTETTIWSSCLKVDDTLLARLGSAPYLPLGQPLLNTGLWVLGKDGQLLPHELTGELFISGKGLAKGYYHDPEKTASRFLEKELPGVGKVRLYQTGDLVRYNRHGDLEFVGRKDGQVKIRGYRIELADIESTLIEDNRVDTAVVLVDKEAHDVCLVAFVKLKAENDSLSDLKNTVKESLPYYMLPNQYVEIQDFPMTPNRKIDRKQLLQDFQNSQSATSSAYAAPRTQLELELVRIWESVLNASHIGIHDDFFALGGHSLLAVRLMSNIQKFFDKVLPIATLFQNPTIAHLAANIQQDHNETWETIVAIQPQGENTPLFIVPGEGGNVIYLSGLSRHLGKEQPVYGFQPPGLDGISEPMQSVEELAAHYIDALKQAFPQVPYRICGHSFGGLVAFEMARQLINQGEDPAQLIILDTVAPNPEPGLSEMAEMDNAAWISLAARRYGGLHNIDIDLKESELAGLDFRQQLELLKSGLESNQLMPSYVTIDQLTGILTTLRVTQRIIYRPEEQISMEIHLIRSQESEAEQEASMDEYIRLALEKPDMEWSRMTSGKVITHQTPGEHNSMFQDPHVEFLAEIIHRITEKTHT